MDSNFHSTVLAHPPGMHDDDDGRRREYPTTGGSSAAAPLAASAPALGTAGGAPPPRNAFSLRSPTHSEFPHPAPYSSPSGPPAAAAANGNNPQAAGAPRNILHGHSTFITSGSSGSSLPPVVPPPSSTSHLQHSGRPRSPLHPPPSGYYPQEAPRESSGTGSFYDPTTDTTTTKQRRVSDAGSWHNAPQTSTPKVSLKFVHFPPPVHLTLTNILPCPGLP
jgi:hypothetical protein